MVIVIANATQSIQIILCSQKYGLLSIYYYLVLWFIIIRNVCNENDMYSFPMFFLLYAAILMIKFLMASWCRANHTRLFKQIVLLFIG